MSFISKLELSISIFFSLIKKSILPLLTISLSKLLNCNVNFPLIFPKNSFSAFKIKYNKSSIKKLIFLFIKVI